MEYADIAIIGGGPAGLSAAITAAKYGMRVVVFDRGSEPGGQLVKQTHRFFGSEKEHAGTRGIDIVRLLREDAGASPYITVKTDTSVLGIYQDGVITYEQKDKYLRMTAGKTIICTGAAEKMLLFENNDLPGVYGAGAVQTLMNLHGVRPGQRVLMVGAGNIGLIVTYQMLQAGVNVVAIVDAAPKVGGYMVHASKVRRLGVPILLQTTISSALGEKCVEGAVLTKVDDNFQPVAGSEQKIDVDTVCLAVGLSPLNELLTHTGAQMRFIPALGGFVPVRSEYMETTAEGVYVAGDLAGIEEATAAMIEGSIAGVSAAIALGCASETAMKDRNLYIEELAALRSGPTGLRIRSGLQQLRGGAM